MSSSSLQQQQICSCRTPAKKLRGFYEQGTEVELIGYHQYTAGTAYIFAGKSNGVLLPPTCCGLRSSEGVRPVRFGGPGEPSQVEAEWIVSHIIVS